MVGGKYGGSPQSQKYHTGFACAVINVKVRLTQIVPFLDVDSWTFLDHKPYSNYFGVFKL